MCTTLCVPKRQASDQRSKFSLQANSNSPFLKLRTTEGVDTTALCEVDLDTLLKERDKALTSFVSQPNVWTNIPPASKEPRDYHKCKGNGVSLIRYFKEILGLSSQSTDEFKLKGERKKLRYVLTYLLGPLVASQLDGNVINLIPKDQQNRKKLAKLLEMILYWDVAEGFDSDLGSKTQFHLTPTHSSAHGASIIVTKTTSDFEYNHERVVGALITVENAKSEKLQVFVKKLKWQHASAPDLALKLNFKLEGSCGTTFADYLYSRGCIRKKIDNIRTVQQTIGETLSLVLNPQRALQIMQSFPLVLSQCVVQMPFDHALSIMKMEFVEESDSMDNSASWKLIEAFIKPAKQQVSISIVVSTSAVNFHTIQLSCEQAFSFKIKRKYKLIDCGVEIANSKYTFKDHSGKLLSTSQFTLESLPEMTLFPSESLKLSTFTDILAAFDLPNPGKCHTELKIPLLDVQLCNIKSFNSPAITLTQVSQHQPEMIVSKLSCNVRGILEEKVFGPKKTIYHYLIDEKYIPDVFGKIEERFNPCVAILNPYGKVPEIQLATYFTAELSTASHTLNLDVMLSASRAIDSKHTNKYTIAITNPSSNVDHSQWLVLVDLLADFGCQVSSYLPSCVTDILTKIEIRRVQFSFSTEDKTLQEFELFCSIKAFDLMEGKISSRAIFIYLSYCRGKGIHIRCRGLLSLFGSEFPLNFSLPTIAKPANVSIDKFPHDFSLSSLLKSSLWGEKDHESKSPLPAFITPDTKDLLNNLKMFDLALLSLNLKISNTSDGTSLWVSKAMISLNIVKHLSLNGLIVLDNVSITIEISKQNTSDCYFFKLELEAILLECLHVTLRYDSDSHCLTGELSPISRNTKKASALYAISNIGSGKENQSTYNAFGDWSKEITTLVTKHMQERETPSLFDSLKLSHAEIVIRHTGGMHFVLDYLSIHIIDLLKDPYKRFNITDLKFEYVTLEGSKVVATENYQPSESKAEVCQAPEADINQETLQTKEAVVQKTTKAREVDKVREKDLDTEDKVNDTPSDESQNTAQEAGRSEDQNDQTQDIDVQRKTCAVLTAIVSVADTKLKIIFDLAINDSLKSAQSKKELTCQVLPINEAMPLSLMSLIEMARCNKPELPDVKLSTNIFDLRIHKGSLTFGFSPFHIKQFDVLLSTAPNWIIYESPYVELENLVFHIIYDSERKENSCQVMFDCNLNVASTSVSIQGSLSRQHVEAAIKASYESETGKIDFKDVLQKWPPSPGKAYRVPTDVNLPELSFTLGHLSLYILLEKNFKQVKLEALLLSKWSVDFARKDDHTSKQVELEFSALGGFLDFQSSTEKPDSQKVTKKYYAMLFGKLQLHDVTLAGQMLLGSEKCNITAYICREELGHKLSFPGIANEFVTEDNFSKMAPKSLVDKLLPTVAILHVDIRTKRLLVCAEMKDLARGVLYLEYRHCDESKKKKKVYCTMVLTLDENFKFNHISDVLQFVDNAVTVKHARLMITSEDRPFTNVLNDMTSFSKDSCHDYTLYESSTVATRTPLPSKVSEVLNKCTHVRSLMTDKLVKDFSQPFTLWPFEQDLTSFTDSLQSGFCIYAAFNIKHAERSPLIRNAVTMTTQPDLRETQLVVVVKCSNILDKSKALVSFKGHLNEIELSDCFLFRNIQVSFDVTYKQLQHLLLEGTLLVQPSDEKFKFHSLSFLGRLEICENIATFEAKAELYSSTVPFGQFGIDPGNSGSSSIASLSVTVKYEKQKEDKHFPPPFVVISGHAEKLFGFLKTNADIVLKGTTFKLFRFYINTSADFAQILKAQMCNDISLDTRVITVHTGELYYSRCSEDERVPNVYGNPKPYRKGLWLDCDISLFEQRLFIEVCFPVSGNKFDIRGGMKNKIKLFGFLSLTNDTFFSGPQLKVAKRGSTVELTLIIGVELWGDPWFVGTLSFKNKVGNYVKSPGFEAGIECKKTIFGWKPPKVVIGWSIASGFEILELPLVGGLSTLMKLSSFLNQWQNVARLAYSLLMSSVRVSVDGKFRMETSRDKVPEGCCCMFVWSGDLVITVIGFIEIPIRLPDIPLAIRTYDPSRHSGLISYLFDCLWTNTKLIAKAIWNYLSLKNLFNVVARAAVETVKRTVKKVVNVVKNVGRGIARFFGIGRGNSFWVLDVNEMPIAYCEYHDSDSPFAMLFGRPLAMKAIQEAAAIILSNARATNELDYGDDSQRISSEELNNLEKYIHELGCKAAQQSEKVLKVDCVDIDVENKQIKWKMSKQEPEMDVQDPTFHIKVVGTVVLGESLEGNVTIFETDSKGIKICPLPDKSTSQDIETDSTKDEASSMEDTTDSLKTETSSKEKANTQENSLTLTDGWLTLDLSKKMNPHAWKNCVCIAGSVYASVSNKVTVLPSGMSDEESSQQEHVTETKEQKEERVKEMEKDIKEKGWQNEVHIRGRYCYTEKIVTKQHQIDPSLSVGFSDHTSFASSENQIVGNIQFPSSTSCIVQLYNTEDCTDILWQKLVKNNEFSIDVRKLPSGSSCGPYKLRALIVSEGDNSPQSGFIVSEFEISRHNSPQCIRQVTKRTVSPQVLDKLQSESDVVFSWKEPGYLLNFDHSEDQPQQVDYTYRFAGKLKKDESDLVLFDGSTQECEFKCQLKALFEKHNVPLSESVNLLFEVATLGDTEKLDSILSATEFIVLAPPTDIEVSPPSEDFGVHIEWKFAANAMSYLIKLVNTSTGLSKVARNHIPEQKLGQQYLKGTKGNERYEFHSRDFESNENDDVFVVHTESDEDIDCEGGDTEECTDTLALLNYADLRKFFQLEPATYKVEMFSSGDGDKCIQSLTSCESSEEEKIEILPSETVHLSFDYKTEHFIVDVQANEVFANGHVIEIIMETKDENGPSSEFLANCVVPSNFTDSTIRTVIKEWKIPTLRQGGKILCGVSSVCPNEHNGVRCTLAQSSNSLEITCPPSKVTFNIPSTTFETKALPDSLETSSDSEVQKTTVTMTDSTAPLVDLKHTIDNEHSAHPFPFSIVLNTIDDLIVSHSSGDIVVSCDTDQEGEEFFVGFVSKTKNHDSTVILFRTYSSNRSTIINLDKLCFDNQSELTCQLFMQLAGCKENSVTSSFALCNHTFHCLKAEIRASKQWEFKTIQVVYPTISLVRILSASVFRKSIIPTETPSEDIESARIKFQNSNVAFDKASSKGKHGYSTRFYIAMKLARKLKCSYAFVYQYDSISKTSEQYEYSVCRRSIQTSKYSESVTISDISLSGSTPSPLLPESVSEQIPPAAAQINVTSHSGGKLAQKQPNSQASKDPVLNVKTQAKMKQIGKAKSNTKDKNSVAKQPRHQLKGNTPKEQTQQKKVTKVSHTDTHRQPSSKDKSKQPTKFNDRQLKQPTIKQQMESDDLKKDSEVHIESPDHTVTESVKEHKTLDSADNTPTLSESDPGPAEKHTTASHDSPLDWEWVENPASNSQSDALATKDKLWFVLLSGKEKIKRQKGFGEKYVKKCKELDGMCWDKLAKELGLPTTIVDNITKFEKEQQKGEFANDWIQHDKQASWSKLVVALRSLELHKVASQIWKTYGDETTRGYIPMFYYDFLDMRVKRTPITLTENPTHTSHLKSSHLKECLSFLPKTTKRFYILIHLRCVGVPNEHNKPASGSGSAWFKFITAIKDVGYGIRKAETLATHTRGNGKENLITEDGKVCTVSRTILARNVAPKLSLEFTTKGCNCKIVELLAIVVPY